MHGCFVNRKLLFYALLLSDFFFICTPLAVHHSLRCKYFHSTLGAEFSPIFSFSGYRFHGSVDYPKKYDGKGG